MSRRSFRLLNFLVWPNPDLPGSVLSSNGPVISSIPDILGVSPGHRPAHVEPLHGNARPGPDHLLADFRSCRTAARSYRRPILFAATSFSLATSSAAIPVVALRFLQAFGPSAVMVATFAAVRDVYAYRSERVVIYGLLTMPYSRRKPARRGVRVARPSSSIGRIRSSTATLGSP